MGGVPIRQGVLDVEGTDFPFGRWVPDFKNESDGVDGAGASTKMLINLFRVPNGVRSKKSRDWQGLEMCGLIP